MKVVAVEISVEHLSDGGEDLPKESGRLSMEDYVDDDAPVQPVVEKLTAELLRRYAASMPAKQFDPKPNNKNV